jgi:hypothetical protein
MPWNSTPKQPNYGIAHQLIKTLSKSLWQPGTMASSLDLAAARSQRPVTFACGAESENGPPHWDRQKSPHGLPLDSKLGAGVELYLEFYKNNYLATVALCCFIEGIP